jgi:uncharacterized protein YfiM (DUF2279 family)
MTASKFRGRAAPSERRLPGTVVLAAALAAVAANAQAGQWHLFPTRAPRAVALTEIDPGAAAQGPRIIEFESAYPWSGRGGADLGLPEETSPDALVLLPAASASPAASQPKLFTTATTLVTAGVMLGGALEGLGAPLQYGWEPFHTYDERWFGRTTYAGGADKASHFTVTSGLSRALYETYVAQGHSEDQSFTLSLATAFMTGAFVEIMDGFSLYGFSFQDLTADALGATAGALIQRHHLGDLIGLRLGPADTEIPAWAIGSSSTEETVGASYSNEIYAADLKLGGLVTRLHGDPGFSRFFLTSFVFFTKGYGYDPPLPSRYQEIGVEVGLNFPEILKAVGVTNETWWGTGLLAVFNFFRIPFTQVGMYYNLHDHKWYGPGAPYHYY